MFRFILLSHALTLSYGGLAFPAEISFEEARAAYLQNMQALGVFRCVVQHETLFTEEHFDVLEQRIARFEEVLPRFPPGNDREGLEIEVARLKELLNAREKYPVRESASMVIGSDCIQIAKPSSGPTPPLPIQRRADLVEDCLQSVVLCWTSRQDPVAWMWQGTGGLDDDVLYATISSKRPQDILGFPVVPIGVPDRISFEPNRLSPFDAVFEDSYAETRVIGEDEFDGQPVLVVERTNETLLVRSGVRASLSMNRSFFPVLIERRSCGADMSLDEAVPSEVLEVSSFHETRNGGFYPSRWTIESRSDDDRSDEVRNSDEPFSVQYTSSIETWTVEDFHANQQEPPLFSEMGFPDGTYCFDEDNKVYFTVGQAEAVVDAILDGSQSPAGEDRAGNRERAGDTVFGPPGRGGGWLFWLNLSAIVGVIALVAWHRMTRMRG